MNLPTKVKWQRWLSPAVWFGLALAVLIPYHVLAVSGSPWFFAPPKPVGDGPDYENIAFHLWQGEGFVFDNTDPAWRAVYAARGNDYAAQLEGEPRDLIMTGRPPALPLLLSAYYALLGRNETAFAALRLTLAICLAVGSALAVYVTALLLRRRVGLLLLSLACLLTLGFAASNRTLRDYATDFLTEPLALLLLQGFVVLAIRVSSETSLGDLETTQGQASMQASRDFRRRTLWACAAGAVFGGLILTRSMFVVWLPAIWLLAVISTPVTTWRRLQIASLLLLSACVVCSPWWIRNVWVLGRWMPLGTQGPITLLGGYCDGAMRIGGDWYAQPEQDLRREFQFRERTKNDTEREILIADAARERVRVWIVSHLTDLPRLATQRAVVHWNPYHGRSLLWKVAMILGAIVLLRLRSPATWWLLGLPLVSTLVVAALYSTGGRFLVPLYGILFTLAGLSICLVKPRFSYHRAD